MRRLVLLIVLAISLALNLILFFRDRAQSPFVALTNANSRPTYFTVHNIAAAHAVATGRGVKVGIIDHYFGYDANGSLYAGGRDFLDDEAAFRKIGEHGLWLSRTLREIAPGVEIYALNSTCPDEERKVEAMVAAIRWAIAEKVDVLTYSDRAISPANRTRLDEAVEDAVAAGVVCVFIHYAHPDNLLPLSMFARETYDREPDVHIYGFDYSVLYLPGYFEFIAGKRREPPYLSVSSTSVVTAGFIAMMKEVDGGLRPGDYRRILIETSRPCTQADGGNPGTPSRCGRVVNAAAAVRRIGERTAEARRSIALAQ